MSGLYTERLENHRRIFEERFPAFLPKAEGMRGTAARAMAYACEAGGKRLRPVLAMEFCRLCCGDGERALPFAAAVEMIHSYSLAHDDMPCMDNSPLRRGRPSVHAAFGEDIALLAGDGLLNRAFEVMLDPANRGDRTAEQVLAAAFALARGAGLGGMVGGQAIDLQSEGRAIALSQLEELQQGKTAALIRAACEAGCLAGGGTAEQLEAAERYGENLGLCFQMVDDILDSTSTAEELGKPAGSDAENQKATYVSLLGVGEARRRAEKRTQDAIGALRAFGESGGELAALAAALLHRKK